MHYCIINHSIYALIYDYMCTLQLALTITYYSDLFPHLSLYIGAGFPSWFSPFPFSPSDKTVLDPCVLPSRIVLLPTPRVLTSTSLILQLPLAKSCPLLCPLRSVCAIPAVVALPLYFPTCILRAHPQPVVIPPYLLVLCAPLFLQH